jgi:uncharacterized membrane protein YfcA
MILAALFLLSWLAATVSGAAGFGGALLLLPVLTAALGVKAAVPVLTLMQLLGNLSRVWFGRHSLQWRPIGLFLIGALPLAVLGSLLFTQIAGTWVTVGIGVLLLLIVLARRMNWTSRFSGEQTLLPGGALVGFVSGAAGSAGPLGAALFLGLNLSASAYVASEAVTAVAMHLTKIIIYQRFAILGAQELQYGLLLGVAMILGSWTGKQIIDRLPKATFRLVVECLLVISALQLIFLA